MITKKIKKKKSDQTVLFSIILLSVTILVIGFLVVSDWKISQKRNEQISKIDSLKSDIQKLEEEKKRLLEGINQGQSPEYLEEVARNQLGLKKTWRRSCVGKAAGKRWKCNWHRNEKFMAENLG